MTTQLIINEERKRREFLYHVYNSAHGQKYFSIPGVGAYGHVVYEKMERNWALGESTIYSLLRYHLDERNISVTTPEAQPPDNGLLEAEHWFRYGKIPSLIYITRKGEAAVESDHELLACLVEGGDVDWGRVDTAVPVPNDQLLSSEQRDFLIVLRQKIGKRFNKEELRSLCGDLVGDYKEIEREDWTAFVRELTLWCVRYKQLPRLLELLKEKRPDETWE